MKILRRHAEQHCMAIVEYRSHDRTCKCVSVSRVLVCQSTDVTKTTDVVVARLNFACDEIVEREMLVDGDAEYAD